MKTGVTKITVKSKDISEKISLPYANTPPDIHLVISNVSINKI